MKVLVVDRPAAAAATAELLADMDVVTTDWNGVLTALSQQSFDVVVSEWPSHATCAEDFVAQLRRARPEYAAVLFLCAQAGAKEIAAAFRGGADDFMRKPITREEIVARVRKAAHLAQLERTFGKQLDQAPKVATRLEKAAAWKRFGPLCAETLSALSGITLQPSRLLGDFVPTHAAEIRLDATGEGAEQRVVIEIEESSLCRLGVAMLGEMPNTAMQLDMLLELANTTAGAYVRSALDDGMDVTMGLPVTLSVDHARRHVEVMDARSTVNVTASDSAVRMRLHLAARLRSSVFIPASRLREGMVLVSDLKSSKGVLIARAGTRISSSHAQRLFALLGPADVVEVADVAA